jgi:hypothetical protein
MSLPIASQNAQYYLQTGCGLACAVSSAGMALFVGALSFELRSVGGVVFVVRSFRRRKDEIEHQAVLARNTERTVVLMVLK